MKISDTGLGLYRLRDGGEARVDEHDPAAPSPWQGGFTDKNGYTPNIPQGWDEDGRWYSRETESGWDIVAYIGPLPDAGEPVIVGHEEGSVAPEPVPAPDISSFAAIAPLGTSKTKRMVIDLGGAVARLMWGEHSVHMIILDPCDADDNRFVPAQSIFISNEGILNLRDALIAADLDSIARLKR